MCGIVGNNFSDQNLTEQMLEKIKHRGPDGQGIHTDGSVVHGHARLSLVDLTSASAQPFKSPSSTLTFNGEVWNFRELRKMLGGNWDTTGDTEVLLRILDTQGLRGLHMVEGMFSFCWTHRGQSWLVRDRFGKIPLYVAKVRKGFLWGSERKAFPHGVMPLAVPPGCSFNLNKGTWERWYTLPDANSGFTGPQGILSHLDRGVRARMDADAPVCCLISGGLDSSLILGLARASHPNVVAYTAYEDPSSCDLEAARRLCSEWEVPLNEVKVSLSKAAFVEAAKCIEIPSKAQVEIAAMCIPLASRISSDGFKACLSGEAADELFGGYGNFCIQASKKPDKVVVNLRKKLLDKMSRGNFIRCNKAFMAHGVECRLPFMDRELVEEAVNLGGSTSPLGKRLLKQAAAGVVPDYIIRRDKETFQGASGSASKALLLCESPTRFYNSVIRQTFGYLTKD